MVDKGITASSIVPAWSAFGRRTAVVGGALVALVSLVVHTPVWVASLRGAAVLVAVLIATRLATALLVATSTPPDESETTQTPESTRAP